MLKSKKIKSVIAKKKKTIPFEFVIEALYEKHPRTRAMFGCTAIYIKEKIMFILYDGKKSLPDKGVWVCTSKEHHDSLKQEIPSLRSIQAFETPVTSWQNIPAESDDFETSVLHACELVLKNDPRIGRVPKPKKRKLSERTST